MTSLIVLDDERAFGDLVAEIACSAGYEAHSCSSVSAFRKKVEWEWPEVLILDLNMPETDGIEILREMKNRHCSSKVILISGMDGRIINSAQRFGKEIGLEMTGTVQKPIRASDLKKMLVTMCADPTRPSPEMLSSAMDKGQLFLLYQPKIQVVTNQIMGVEALVRWRNDVGRTIPPDDFIPMAESTGLIDRLTSIVVDQALTQARKWKEKGLTLNIAINLSAKSIHDRQLPDILSGKCKDADINPETITLELTETASMLDFSTLLEVLGRFRIKGFKLSIDDFGTGYSSAAQLLRLPFSELKVDKSFISQMTESRESAVVAKTIIDMAHNLGLSSVAEGVETDVVFKTLMDWNCDIAQGYLFSKPAEPEVIIKMLNGDNKMEALNDYSIDR